MKKLSLLLILFAFSCNLSFAKKVKFTVDMRYFNDNLITGIHVAGDFQAVAGYPGGDWQSGTTLMTSSGDTNYYSVVVDIPAFRKYEYKFINGDQWYEAEFVPFESRVGYNFNDNRWIYIDSLTNDTTNIDPVLFGGNAPEGQFLTRYLVDMSNEATIATDSVHMAGNFQGWNNATHFLFSFTPGIYEIIIHDTAGTHEYKYLNGESMGNFENVPGACSTNGNRTQMVFKDSVLNAVCFSSCGACITGISFLNNSALKIYPNPSLGEFYLTPKNGIREAEVIITDMQGKILYRKYHHNIDQEKVSFSAENAVYFVNLMFDGKLIAKEKLIIQK
jgi:hypothetical protein